MDQPWPSPIGPLELVQARPADLETVMAILNEAAAWLAAKGIRQWAWPAKPHHWRRMAQAIGRGEFWLARDPTGQAVACFRLLWSDEATWGADGGQAAYVHSLAIRSHLHGLELGRALLAWAGARAREEGRRFLRLDCLASNRAIARYYEGLGFACRGEKRDHDYQARLYELAL